MKLNQPTDNDWTLYAFEDTLQAQIIKDALYDMNKPKGQRHKEWVEKYFLQFIKTFHTDYLDEYDSNLDLQATLAYVLATPQLDPWGVVNHLAGGVPKEFHEDAQILFANALIYAIANEYKFVIPGTYMRKSNALPGTVLPQYTDGGYVTYMKETHPDVANYVIKYNKLFSKKTLAVMGYLINPQLVGED